MDERDTRHEVFERLSILEQRVKSIEAALSASTHDIKSISDDLKRELARQSEDLALTRQAVRIFEDVARGLESQLKAMAADAAERMREITDENKTVLAMLHEHQLQDASDKMKVLVGVIVSSGAGLTSLGVLIWGVMQVVAK
jgi:hypothetical protein